MMTKIKNKPSTTFTKKSVSPTNIHRNPLLFKWYFGVKRKSGAGFVLLFAILITGVISAAALGISKIVNKEIVLASIGKDSQLAFFAADSGAECALYWNNQGSFDRNTSATEPIYCGGVVLKDGQLNEIVNSNKKILESEISSSVDLTGNNILGGQNISVFGFGTENDLTEPCSLVIIDKRDPVITKIVSKGYNTCTQTRRRVERALEVTVAG